MKFEKFLKSVGTHGEVITIGEFDKWLVCAGVGMRIPEGVDNILGVNKSHDYATIVDVISKTELDEPLSLIEAVLLDPTGKANDIYRVFETDLGDSKVAIINSDYGLIEKSDNLGYLEIETDDGTIIKYVLVYDKSGQDIQGYITGSSKF